MRRYQVPVMVTFESDHPYDSSFIANEIHTSIFENGLESLYQGTLVLADISGVPADDEDPGSPPVPAEDLDPWWTTIGRDGQEV
jgi:hypothetical protein